MGGFDHAGFQQRLLAAAGGDWFDFEGLIRDIYVAILRPGDLCVDVGVNRGDHFFQMARAVHPGGKVIGFEAAPAMVAQVRPSMIRGDQAPTEAMELVEVAVSDQPGEAVFYFSAVYSGLSSLFQRHYIETEPITVRLETLDALMQGRGPVRFMKMDIEGAEYLAFLGARRMLTASKPLIAFEFDKGMLSAAQNAGAKMLELLHGLGYRVFDFFGHEMAGGEDLYSSDLWNYLAAPQASADLPLAFAVVRESLAAQGIVVPD